MHIIKFRTDRLLFAVFCMYKILLRANQEYSLILILYLTMELLQLIIVILARMVAFLHMDYLKVVPIGVIFIS